MEEKEIIQNRITNLISLRQTMTQALIVLIGGMSGICFMPHSTGKYILFALGAVGIIVVVKVILEYKKEIRKYLYTNRGDK